MVEAGSPIDEIGAELSELADAYARKAAALASDPYFQEAVLKVSVAGFVWALFREFEDDLLRSVLNEELKVQSAVVDRAVSEAPSTAHQSHRLFSLRAHRADPLRGKN